MDPHITSQATSIPTNRCGGVEEGALIFADNTLMAVVLLLRNSIDGDLDSLRGQWFLETGYGPCTVGPGVDQLFRSPNEAQAWVLERVTRSREGAAAHTPSLRLVP